MTGCFPNCKNNIKHYVLEDNLYQNTYTKLCGECLHRKMLNGFVIKIFENEDEWATEQVIKS
jgi:hypothetical protein